jgi:mannose-6-phosphate isomerase
MEGKPRSLNIQHAMNALDPGALPHKKKGLEVREGSNCITFFLACHYFSLEKLVLRQTFSGDCDKRHFICFSVLDGKAELLYQGGVIDMKKGESLLLPAYLGQYKIVPCQTCTLLRSYVPDMDRDIFSVLTSHGFTAGSIRSIVHEID